MLKTEHYFHLWRLDFLCCAKLHSYLSSVIESCYHHRDQRPRIERVEYSLNTFSYNYRGDIIIPLAEMQVKENSKAAVWPCNVAGVNSSTITSGPGSDSINDAGAAAVFAGYC